MQLALFDEVTGVSLIDSVTLRKGQIYELKWMADIEKYFVYQDGKLIGCHPAMSFTEVGESVAAG